MITLKSMAGLGNQMFQYAYLKQIQHLCGDKKLVIDTSGNIGQAQAHEVFQLEGFNIDKTIIIIKKKTKGKNLFKRFWQLAISVCLQRRKFRKFMPITNAFAYFFHGIISDYMADKLIGKKRIRRKNKILFGYFQSEKYFDQVTDQVKNDFQIIEQVKPENVETLEDIKKSESVCVHIRLGDYTWAQHKSVWDAIPPGYYKNAVLHLCKNLKNPKFFIFSNEIDKAKDKLLAELGGEADGIELVFVTQNNTAVQELNLMKSCKHFVIANSTFSWWAQYLGDAENKIVIAPEKWMRHGGHEEIFMKNWIHMGGDA